MQTSLYIQFRGSGPHNPIYLSIINQLSSFIQPCNDRLHWFWENGAFYIQDKLKYKPKYVTQTWTSKQAYTTRLVPVPSASTPKTIPVLKCCLPRATGPATRDQPETQPMTAARTRPCSASGEDGNLPTAVTLTAYPNYKFPIDYYHTCDEYTMLSSWQIHVHIHMFPFCTSKIF
jgi:hypothetical protein